MELEIFTNINKIKKKMELKVPLDPTRIRGKEWDQCG